MRNTYLFLLFFLLLVLIIVKKLICIAFNNFMFFSSFFPPSVFLWIFPTISGGGRPLEAKGKGPFACQDTAYPAPSVLEVLRV